jgi:hypothetical protein
MKLAAKEEPEAVAIRIEAPTAPTRIATPTSEPEAIKPASVQPTRLLVESPKSQPKVRAPEPSPKKAEVLATTLVSEPPKAQPSAPATPKPDPVVASTVVVRPDGLLQSNLFWLMLLVLGVSGAGVFFLSWYRMLNAPASQSQTAFNLFTAPPKRPEPKREAEPGQSAEP